MDSISIGDTVMVRGDFGTAPAQQVRVNGIGEEAGRTVIDYCDASGLSRWAYLYQVEPLTAPVVAGAVNILNAVNAKRA